MSQAPLPDPHVLLQAATAGHSHGTNGNAKSSGVKTNGVTTRSRKA